MLWLKTAGCNLVLIISYILGQREFATTYHYRTAGYSNPTSPHSQEMAEYEDVLTNQPVVIDNVCSTRCPSRPCAYLAPLRVQALSRRASLAKIIQNASSHPCMYPPCFAWNSTRLTPCCSVGRPKHVRVMAGALEGDVFIGRRAQEFRGLLKIKYPMEHGIVTDWDDMERIWSWIYAEELGTLSEEVRCILVLPALISNTCLAASRTLD